MEPTRLMVIPLTADPVDAVHLRFDGDRVVAARADGSASFAMPLDAPAGELCAVIAQMSLRQPVPARASAPHAPAPR